MQKIMHRLHLPHLVLLALVAGLTAAATQPPNLNLSKAIEAQKTLVTESPRDSAALNDLGNLYRLANRFDDAIDAYQRSIEIDPKRVPSRYNLALVLEQTGKRTQALKQLEEVVDLDAGYAWAHYQIGAILEAKGNASAAVNAYARAFALNPELAQPKVNPQVIDNKLVTEALLKAYRREAVTPAALNTYEDPRHIAALLVPPPVRSESAPQAAQTGGDGTAPKRAAASPTSTRGKAPSNRVASKGGEGVPENAITTDRVLTADDLGGRRTGQVEGGAKSSARGGSRTATINQPVRSWTAGGGAAGYPVNSAPGSKTNPTATTPRVTNPTAPGLVRPGATTPFQPGTNSTGSFRSNNTGGFGQPRPPGG